MNLKAKVLKVTYKHSHINQYEVSIYFDNEEILTSTFTYEQMTTLHSLCTKDKVTIEKIDSVDLFSYGI